MERMFESMEITYDRARSRQEPPMATRLRLGTLVLAAAFLLVGCGGGSSDDGSTKADVSKLSPTALLAKAEKVLAAKESVSVKGAGTDATDGSELSVDMAFVGGTASGTIGINGLEFQMLGADGKSYFKASDDFYRSIAGSSADAVIAKIAGRWVIAPADDPDFAELAAFADKDTFLGGLLDPDGKVTKGKPKTIGGIDCVALTSSSGGTFYLDKRDGTPISLVMGENGTGTLTFSYEDLEPALAPTAAEQVDLNELG